MPVNDVSCFVQPTFMEDCFAIQEMRQALERIAVEVHWFRRAPDDLDVQTVREGIENLLNYGRSERWITEKILLMERDAEEWVAREAHKYYDPPEE